MNRQTCPPIHAATWELLPWLVNGSIRDADRRRVEAHLRDCADCRDEYAFQQRLHAGLQAATDDANDDGRDARARQALARLWARIDAEPDRSARTPLRAKRGNLVQRLLVAALLAQASALAAIATIWLVAEAPGPSRDEPRYRTYGQPDATPPEATIRLVPAPDLRIDALQTMLADARLRIVGSSRDGSVLALAPVDSAGSGATGRPAAGSDAHTAVAVARLRSEPGILLAEPILSPGGMR